MMRKALRIYASLFRLDNSAFTFVSGVFVSATVNYYTTISLASPEVHSPSKYVYLSIALMLTASVLWLVIAVRLQPLQDTFKQTPRAFAGVEDVWNEIISKEIGALALLLNIAIILSIMSLVFQRM